MGPVHDFELGPLSQNFLDNLVGTWHRKTILRHIIKEWIQLQQTEKYEFMINKRIRELQTLSVHQKRRRQD